MNEGKKDRRDPIRTVKPRNFVAKNAMSTTSGAGAHKDRKKAMKQGDVKHKKQEYAEHLENALKNKLAEEFDNPEYNDEAGMSHNSLRTIHRAAVGLMKTIDSGDNLPEWCQEKISLAEDYLVTVWDYIQSEKEQGIDPETNESGLQYYTGKKKYGADGMKALAAAGRKGANQEELGRIKDKYLKKEDPTEGLRDPKDNPCWKGYKPVGTKKKGGRTVPNCVPKEGWTHDSLAAQLFETENTYEQYLANRLKEKLQKK